MSTRPGGEGTWTRAGIRALVVFALAVVGFVILPDRVVTSLSERVPAATRDLAVLAIVVVWFVALSWLFVRLQSRRET